MQAQKKDTNILAVVSLVCGAASLLLVCCLGPFAIIPAIAGLVLAFISKKDEPMDMMAKIGLGLSIGGIVIGFVVLFLLIIGFTVG